MENQLDDQLRDLKFQQRLEQIALVSRHDHPKERSDYATKLIRELAMHRVFDRFRKEQQETLLDLLQSLATSGGVEVQPAFGQGAVSQLRFSYE